MVHRDSNNLLKFYVNRNVHVMKTFKRIDRARTKLNYKIMTTDWLIRTITLFFRTKRNYSMYTNKHGKLNKHPVFVCLGGHSASSAELNIINAIIYDIRAEPDYRN